MGLVECLYFATEKLCGPGHISYPLWALSVFSYFGAFLKVFPFGSPSTGSLYQAQSFSALYCPLQCCQWCGLLERRGSLLSETSGGQPSANTEFHDIKQNPALFHPIKAFGVRLTQFQLFSEGFAPEHTCMHALYTHTQCHLYYYSQHTAG